MNAVTEIARYRRIKQQIAKDQNHSQAIHNALSGLAIGARPRVESKVAKAILLNSPWAWDGRPIDIIAKSVGAGVYELSTKPEETKRKD